MAADTSQDKPITVLRMVQDLFGTNPTDCPWCRCCKKALCAKSTEEGRHCIDLVQESHRETVRACPCAPPGLSSVDEGNTRDGR